MENYYTGFHNIWNNIHRGRAYNFYDLGKEEQEKIIVFLIETDKYQDKKVRDLVYELKTNYLNDFENKSEKNIKVCNESYRKLVEIIINKYDKEN